MAGRDIAAEVLKGLREVREHRAGKRTLRTFRVEANPLPGITPELIRSTREELAVSRAVFARLLRVPVRTVEGWEQGRSRPEGCCRGADPARSEVPGHPRPARLPVRFPGQRRARLARCGKRR